LREERSRSNGVSTKFARGRGTSRADGARLIREHRIGRASVSARSSLHDVRFKDGSSILTIQFRVQFLDSSARVIRGQVADARNAVDAIALVVRLDWPARAEIMRVLDLDGFEVHSRVKNDTKS
jgi:hypothetical protein